MLLSYDVTMLSYDVILFIRVNLTSFHLAQLLLEEEELKVLEERKKTIEKDIQNKKDKEGEENKLLGDENDSILTQKRASLLRRTESVVLSRSVKECIFLSIFFFFLTKYWSS
jgi:hypothetical protein